MLTVVDLLVLDRREVVAGAVEPPVVVPADPLEGGQLDCIRPGGSRRLAAAGAAQPSTGISRFTGVCCPMTFRHPADVRYG